ncbi:YqjF family protein [Streptomyces sp. NPDC090025]|uniref:YqjF family protein n=1 Tax=Streptomyces sp. NPDC090025 TaxID=3365922 RepID=UPI0038364B21
MPSTQRPVPDPIPVPGSVPPDVTPDLKATAGTTPEPVTVDPPHDATPTLLTQSWLDLAFLHWAVDPAEVAPLLPKGTVPDVFDGVTYVGLVAFRMHRVGWFRLPGVPYLGSFPETNVRLYSVDAHGRRGVVFRSLDASRLLPVLVGRWAFRIPYVWSRMSVRQDGATLTYTSSRRWPGPRGARSALAVRVGDPIAEPTPLEHFLTARWGLHSTVPGRAGYLPNAHPRWPLHRAELLSCDEDLIAAAGLTAPKGPPLSVLYSPGVPVRFGPPPRVPSEAGARSPLALPHQRNGGPAR